MIAKPIETVRAENEAHRVLAGLPTPAYDGRTPEAQLRTARMLLAQFIVQIEEHEEHEETGAHADRIDQLREGHAKWTARVAELEAQVSS